MRSMPCSAPAQRRDFGATQYVHGLKRNRHIVDAFVRYARTNRVGDQKSCLDVDTLLRAGRQRLTSRSGRLLLSGASASGCAGRARAAATLQISIPRRPLPRSTSVPGTVDGTTVPADFLSDAGHPLSIDDVARGRNRAEFRPLPNLDDEPYVTGWLLFAACRLPIRIAGCWWYRCHSAVPSCTSATKPADTRGHRLACGCPSTPSSAASAQLSVAAHHLTAR